MASSRSAYQADGLKCRLLRPQIDNGVLDVLFLKPGRLLGWVQILAEVLWDNGVVSRISGLKRVRSREVRSISTSTGRRIWVSFFRPEQLELDGDGLGEATVFAIEVGAGKLTVRAPARY